MESLIDAGTGRGITGDDETKYLMELMLYAPLAYLCNDVLESLNFLRECPLLTCRQSVLAILANCFDNCCSFLVAQAGHVRIAGTKYLRPASTSLIASRRNEREKPGGSETGKTDPLLFLRGKDYVSVPRASAHDERTDGDDVRLDCMYARAMAQVFMPHALTVLDQIFDGHIGGPVTSSRRKFNVRRIEEHVTEARAWLPEDAFRVLLNCWRTLEDAGLLPPAKNIKEVAHEARANALSVPVEPENITVTPPTLADGVDRSDRPPEPYDSGISSSEIKYIDENSSGGESGLRTSVSNTQVLKPLKNSKED
jgi:hypothetical protein